MPVFYVYAWRIDRWVLIESYLVAWHAHALAERLRDKGERVQVYQQAMR